MIQGRTRTPEYGGRWQLRFRILRGLVQRISAAGRQATTTTATNYARVYDSVTSHGVYIAGQHLNSRVRLKGTEA